METKGKANDPKSWDDLVFENRNVDYGAYTVRKSYTGNLTSGFLLSVSFGGLLFVVPMITSLFDEDIIDDKNVDIVLRSDTIVFEQERLIIPVTPPPPAPRHRVIPPVVPSTPNVPPMESTGAV